VSQLNPDNLVKIKHCFQDLQPQVKLKLLLSFFHISRRNLELWRTQLETILEVALRDSEPWVSMLAELMKTYPSTGQLNCEVVVPESNRKIYLDILTDLKKRVVKKHGEQSDIILPLECHFLNKNAFISVVGHQPQPTKHFHLKRKPKAAALKADLMQKSIEAANKIKSSNSSAFPTRRGTLPKKMSDTTPLKGLPSRPLHNSGFRPPRVSLPNRQNVKKEGGVKLLDINEQPIGGYSKKRKRQQEIEDAKKAVEDNGHGGVQQNANNTAHIKSENIAPPQNNPTPDYAANLAGASLHNSVPPPAYVPPTPQAPQQAPPPPPAYVPVQQTAVTLPLATHQASLPGNPVTVALPTVPHPGISVGTRIVQLPTQPIPQARVAGLTTQQAPLNLGQEVLVPATQLTATRTIIQQQQQPQQLQQHLIIQQPRQTFIQQQPQQQQQQQQQQQILRQPTVQTIQAPAQTQTGQRRNLSLTREQMLEAQEMFRTANRVTRPEKALILGFMAGSRENPCPHLGSIVTIKLSENQENVPQNDNTYLTMIVETHFQMNYNTGEWKRIKKYRRLEDVMQ